MQVKILGSAAGGGFPQWNCACSNCSRLRLGTLRGGSRTQVQLAVSLDHEHWCLVNASPDLRAQIEATPELQPGRLAHQQTRTSPISSVVLTNGDLDQTLGLLLLREFQPLEIYVTASVGKILTEENSFFRMLQRVSPQAVWHDIAADIEFGLSAETKKSVTFRPIPLPGKFPEYVSAELSSRLPASEAVFGLEIQSLATGKKLIYCPGLPQISKDLLARFASCDLLLLDGTFWSDDELIRIAGANRTAQQMGHVPISGIGGSLERLRAVTRPTKIYTHINNTNPILDEDSAEFAQVTSAGWAVAHDGMSFDL
jgi:pyrroloquinoline quinone biosynthesis protein B